jgi:Flp pilus assembly protein TadD/O-antigen ligase
MLVLAAIALVALAGVEALAKGRFVLPGGPLPAVLGGLCSVLIAATFVADQRWVAVVGPYTRFSGLGVYLACAVVTWTVATRFDATSGRLLAFTIVGSLGFVAAYGLLQVAGADPVQWGDFDLSTWFSTLGQTNFAAGYIAVGAPLALWAVLERTLDLRVRVASVAVLVAAVAYLPSTKSFQGVVAALAGASVVLGVYAAQRLRERPGISRRRVGLGLTLTVIVVAGVGLVLSGPVRDQLDSGFEERRLLWRAAVSMVSDSPVIGHGLGSYGALFPSHRPTEHAATYGLSMADAPHSVPLDLAVGGGALLLVAYVAFVGITVMALVKGLRTLPASQRLLLAGLGGGWVAYQVQSLVSIDVPALVVLHWLLAGAVLALGSGVRLREVRLPFGLGERTGRRRSGPVAVSSAIRAAQAGVVVSALVVAWFATRPLRAELAAHAAVDSFRRGDAAAALDHVQRAVELAPSEGQYWALEATIYQQLGRLEPSVEAGQRADRAAPGVISYGLTTAQLLAVAGRTTDAERYFEELIRRDPDDVQLLSSIGTARLEMGDAEGAEELFARLSELQPDEPAWWRSLSEARRATGDAAGADSAGARAVEIETEVDADG